jgi:nucleotide-binding universal stress UspA family protein
MPGEEVDEESRKKADDNIQLFVETCTEANVLFSTSGGGETSFDDLMRQSAFADLIMVDAGTDFPGSPFIPLMISLHDLLAAAHCPVLVLKEALKVPRQIILSYDGSYSSIHAIKMFSYVFPEWRSVPACLLSVYTKSNAALEYEEYIKDWLSHHFTSLRIDLLKGEPRKTLVDEVRSRGGDALVVMGAYGGTALSRLFHKSISNNIISETRAALFMSHERQNA